jgi:hypothetical protein
MTQAASAIRFGDPMLSRYRRPVARLPEPDWILGSPAGYIIGEREC